MQVMLRADGNGEIGYGHLVRTGSLTETLLDRGHDVTFVTTTPETARSIVPEAALIRSISSRDDPRPLLELCDREQPDIVYTDAYPVTTDTQQAIREEVTLAVLQDDTRHAICADLFVNGNLYADALAYEFVGPPARTCLGPDYVLLRREIRTQLAESPPWRDPPEHCLVTLGAGDVAALTPTVIRALDGLGLDIDAIVGPGCSADQHAAIEAAARTADCPVTVERDPADLPARMFGADIAVTTASTTTYELLALGTPLVSIPVVANQERLARALRERDAAEVLPARPDEPAIRAGVATYCRDRTRRRRRRRLGRELVDGRGTKRVAAALETVARDQE